MIPTLFGNTVKSKVPSLWTMVPYRTQALALTASRRVADFVGSSLTRAFVGPTTPKTPAEQIKEFSSKIVLLINAVCCRQSFDCDVITEMTDVATAEVAEIYKSEGSAVAADVDNFVGYVELLMYLLLCILEDFEGQTEEGGTLFEHRTIRVLAEGEEMPEEMVSEDEDEDEDSELMDSARHDRHQLVWLREWYAMKLVQNQGNRPYLDDEDLEILMCQTGLTDTQIRNWVSNERRRRKAAQVHPKLLETTAKFRQRRREGKICGSVANKA